MVSSINIQEHFVCTIYDLNDNKCDPHPFPRTTGSAGKYVPWRTYGRTCRWNRARQSPNPGETGWSECTSNQTQRGVCAAHCLQSSGAVYKRNRGIKVVFLLTTSFFVVHVIDSEIKLADKLEKPFLYRFTPFDSGWHDSSYSEFLIHVLNIAQLRKVWNSTH